MIDQDSLITAITPALITSIATTLITSLLYWRKAKADLQKEYESKFNSKRWEVYLKFIDLVRIIFYREKSIDGHNVELSEDEILSLASQVLLIGSNDVVEAFSVWRKLARERSVYDNQTKEKLVLLINEMSKDLGNRSSRLEYETIRGIFSPKRAN